MFLSLTNADFVDVVNQGFTRALPKDRTEMVGRDVYGPGNIPGRYRLVEILQHEFAGHLNAVAVRIIRIQRNLALGFRWCFPVSGSAQEKPDHH